MKYVMFQMPDGAEFPLFCLAPLGHDWLAKLAAAKGGVPVGAGFVQLHVDGSPEIFGRSVSLGLGPRIIDRRIIEVFYSATLKLAKETPG